MEVIAFYSSRCLTDRNQRVYRCALDRTIYLHKRKWGRMILPVGIQIGDACPQRHTRSLYRTDVAHWCPRLRVRSSFSSPLLPALAVSAAMGPKYFLVYLLSAFAVVISYAFFSTITTTKNASGLLGFNGSFNFTKDRQIAGFSSTIGDTTRVWPVRHDGRSTSLLSSM